MKSKHQHLFKALIIIAIITAIVAILALLSFSERTFNFGVLKLFGLCLSLLAFGLTATVSMVISEKQDYKLLGIAGVIVSAIGFLFFALIIITGIQNQTQSRIASILSISTLSITHISLLHLINPQNRFAQYARNTATIAICLFSLLWINQIFQSFPFLFIPGVGGDLTQVKLLMAAFVVCLTATLLVPLCNRLNIKEPNNEVFIPQEEAINTEITNNSDCI